MHNTQATSPATWIMISLNRNSIEKVLLKIFIKEIAHLRGNVLLLRMGHHLQLFLFGLLGFRLSRFRLRGFEFLGFWILVFCHGNSPKRSADLRSSYRKLNWISNNYRRATGR